MNKSAVQLDICFHLDDLKRKQVIPKLLNCYLMNKIEP